MSIQYLKVAVCQYILFDQIVWREAGEWRIGAENSANGGVINQSYSLVRMWFMPKLRQK